jgi:hypothetical protein
MIPIYPGPDPLYLSFTIILRILAYTLNRSEYTKKTPALLEDPGLGWAVVQTGDAAEP